MERRRPKSLITHQNKTASMISLNAVAYQDHWARMLSIGKSGPRQLGLGHAARAKQKKEIQPVVDTAKPKPKVKQATEREYVLDEKPPPLTLAQKLGLVEAPPQHLSEEDWTSVKAKSNARDDSKEPCVICKEDFGLQEQVLLSCSHVFHRACLQAFERYTGRKTCPMCRREQYQTRVIHEGAKMHKHKSATRIQAAWRGYVVRCWYKKLRQTVPPNDPKLRQKFYIAKLEAITDRMIKSCDFDVSSFLREIDHTLEQSRDVFRHFDAIHRTISEEEWEMIQLKAVERCNQDCPICLTSLTAGALEQPVSSIKQGVGKNSSGQSAASKRTASQPTNNSQASTQRPGLAEGPRNSSQKVKEENMPKLVKNTAKSRKTVLLSCTHVFHETCLLTLEELAMGDIRNSCPVCRSMYQKRAITIWG